MTAPLPLVGRVTIVRRNVGGNRSYLLAILVPLLAVLLGLACSPGRHDPLMEEPWVSQLVYQLMLLLLSRHRHLARGCRVSLGNSMYWTKKLPFLVEAAFSLSLCLSRAALATRSHLW